MPNPRRSSGDVCGSPAPGLNDVLPRPSDANEGGGIAPTGIHQHSQSIMGAPHRATRASFPVPPEGARRLGATQPAPEDGAAQSTLQTRTTRHEKVRSGYLDNRLFKILIIGEVAGFFPVQSRNSWNA